MVVIITQWKVREYLEVVGVLQLSSLLVIFLMLLNLNLEGKYL